MQPAEILSQHVSKTINLTNEQFDYVLTHFKPRFYKNGQSLITAGDKVDS